MSIVTGFEGFVMLLPWFQVDAIDGAAPDKYRWFQWGRIQEKGGDYSGWYILIGLPSYSMRPLWSMSPYAEPMWHQAYLVFRGRLPAGEESWLLIDVPCWDRPPANKKGTTSG